MDEGSSTCSSLIQKIPFHCSLVFSYPSFPTSVYSTTGSQEKLQELTQLAQEVIKIDMYRAETCSVLGQH